MTQRENILLVKPADVNMFVFVVRDEGEKLTCQQLRSDCKCGNTCGCCRCSVSGHGEDDGRVHAEDQGRRVHGL